MNKIRRDWIRDITPTTTLTTTVPTPNITLTTTLPTTSIPVATPVNINLTFERSSMQWLFPLQVGTPFQALNVPIISTSSLLWVVSQLCMSPFGDACNVRTTNFFNTSLSNTISGKFDEFTFKYINGSEIIAIWANDTITMNNQTLEQAAIGLPKDMNGNESNIIIPDTINGQIGINPYQNYILDRFANEIVGIALTIPSNDSDSYGGIITFGGVDPTYIIGLLQIFNLFIAAVRTHIDAIIRLCGLIKFFIRQTHMIMKLYLVIFFHVPRCKATQS
ncbi:aspartic peptidase domain-containing protein [Gigaspora rosea]|uniref:Aspartic peptidase domain-containing protein n=1 Tax=Gigaspora rosea TaxID=44941 RepID=A0A397V979_9GLOM|nr:aspartic peptidase domain-containing protein [Gigaspora rosea]